MFEFLRHVNDERHVESGEIRPAFAARHAGAVVAVVENDRVVGQPRFLELLEVFADKLVHHRDAIVILRPVLAHLRRVRMVGRDSHLGRVVDAVGRVDFVPNLALVTNCVVEYGKERLAVGSVFPMRLSTALVPDQANFFEIVILLGIVRAVVAELAEVNRVHFEVARQAGHAAHVLRAGGRWVDAGDDCRSCRGADGGIRTGPGVAEAALGQAI